MNKIEPIRIRTHEELKDLKQGQVYFTTNYSLLGLMNENREVKQFKINRLKKSVEKRNMLERRPGEINAEFKITDGQTRYAVAEAMQVPFYFTYAPDAKSIDIQLLNANTYPWNTYDYLNYYIKLNNPEYIKAKEFADEYRISVPIAMQLLRGKVNTERVGHEIVDIRESFKNGTFVIKQYEWAEKVASLITEVRKYTPDMAWRHVDCIRALVIVVNKIDPKLLTNALTKYNQTVTRRYAVIDYLKQFENIISAGGKQVKLTI
jgi:hypothetical protein